MMKLNQYEVLIDNIMHHVVKIQDIKVVLREMAKDENKDGSYVEALDDMYKAIDKS